MRALPLDPHVVDSLMPDLVGHDRQPSAFLVYLVLWRRTHGEGRDAVQVPLRELAECTGLSQRAVQDALGRLVRRKLLEVSRAGVTAVAVYTVKRPWLRSGAT